ncbi:MAG: hypothetical protein H7A46_26275 [Verrucomicrobiales bacterium]|nr:hypothetical protein [Verrucomicrobiales bacterium]
MPRTSRSPAAPARRLVPGGLALAAGLLLYSNATVIDDMAPCHPSNWAWNQVDITHSCDDGRLTLRAINDPGPLDPSKTSAAKGSPDYAHVAVYNQGFFDLPLREDEVLELRVDYISANRDDVFATLLYGDGSVTDDLMGWYALARDRNEVALIKSSTRSSMKDTVIFWETLPPTDDPVTMVLAMTRQGDTAQITVRLQLKADPSQVLFERTVLDGPGVDFTNEGLIGPKGWQSVPDIGAPYMEMGLWQELGIFVASDGGEPLPELVLDNLEYHYIPLLDVQKAVCLSWPVVEGEFVVESAPAADGPWTQVPEAEGHWVEVEARQQVWVLATEQARFFRLREVETP